MKHRATTLCRHRRQQRRSPIRPAMRFESLEPRTVLAGVVITEFMASNQSTLADIDGDYPDWIEIHNATDADVDLTGWHLTDDANDLAKWTFPTVILATDEYFVVFASDKDRIDTKSELHTNFKLSASGEYLALVDPALQATNNFGDAYPAQRADVSYGLSSAGNNEFFETPTPGQPNAEELIRFLPAVESSHPSGFYETEFELTLTSPAPDTVIRYTTDGNLPSSSEGQVYSGAISVRGSTIVQAAAFREGFQPESITTRTYIFLADVISQTNEGVIARGFPRFWGGMRADYAMDPEVIGGAGVDRFDGKYAETIVDDLKSIPSLSLVVDPDSLFGPRGIYSNPENRGSNFEKPASGELIDPASVEALRFNAGIRIQGGISREVGVKHSLRLSFRGRYGATKLEYPLFGENAADTFDSISLRSSSGEVFVDTHYIRDTYARESQLATGNAASHGRFFHVYLNGIYWGVYEAVERPDARFAANYYEGDKDDWDVINAGDLGNEKDTAISGDLVAWQHLVELANGLSRVGSAEREHEIFMQMLGLNPDGSNNPEYETLLDVDNYIDYLITNVYLSNEDWPHRNYYMARQRGVESTGFKFFTWDAEFTLDEFANVSMQGLLRLREPLGPSQILNGLSHSEDFRVRFADRVHEHFSPGGAFYVDPENSEYDPENPTANVPAARYDAIVQEFRSPLVGESARWGDGISNLDDSLLTRDERWQSQVRDHFDYFSERSKQLLNGITRAGFYRVPPTFSLRGGVVNATDQLEFHNLGTTYYTLDGTDPRLLDGTVSPAAVRYDGPIPLASSVQVTARTFDGGFWSAVESHTYLTRGQPDGTSLRISEIHYHPADPTPSELAAGYTTSDFEFIELVNTSAQTIELAGSELIRVDAIGDDEGVDYRFGEGHITQLGPGERIVVVEDIDAFRFRYDATLPVAGQWSGRLNNEGELLTLQVNGLVVQQFRYDGAWQPSTNGGGHSLEIVDTTTSDLQAWEQPDHWQPSANIGGTPGTDVAPPTRGDFDGNGFVDDADIDLLLTALRQDGLVGPFDLTSDGLVTAADLDELLIGILDTRPGDANLDGRVDALDFNALGQHWLFDSDVGWSDGDLNGDDKVDVLDLNVFAQNWLFGVPARAVAERAIVARRLGSV